MNRKDRRAAGIKSASGASRSTRSYSPAPRRPRFGSKPLAAVLAAVGTVADVDGKLPGPSFLPDLHLHFVFGGKQVCARLVPSDGETPAGVVQGEEDPRCLH